MIEYTCLVFSKLTIEELYALLQLRQKVFICEQQSIYDDIDGADAEAFHIQAKEADELLGYMRFRVLPEKQQIKFERVVLAKSARGKGVGETMFAYALEQASMVNSTFRSLLSAQTTIISFYEKFGFSVASEPYDDGGIMHVDMQK